VQFNYGNQVDAERAQSAPNAAGRQAIICKTRFLLMLNCQFIESATFLNSRTLDRGSSQGPWALSAQPKIAYGYGLKYARRDEVH
jgi:hypothetical protein